MENVWAGGDSNIWPGQRPLNANHPQIEVTIQAPCFLKSRRPCSLIEPERNSCFLSRCLSQCRRKEGRRRGFAVPPRATQQVVIDPVGPTAVALEAPRQRLVALAADAFTEDEERAPDALGGRRAAGRCLRGAGDEGSGCPPALAVRSGAKTGRSPKDKRVGRQASEGRPAWRRGGCGRPRRATSS